MLGACRLSFQRMVAVRTLFSLRQSVPRLPRRGRATQAAATKSKDKEGREAELKKKALADAVKKLNSRFPGAVVSVHDAFAPVDTVSTGAMTLDIALGGGYPKGRIIEIYGPESSGKTTLALHAIAEVQKQGGSAVFIDAEHALSPEYAIALGVDYENMLTSQPESGEQAMEIARELIKSAAVDIVVVDSVAALVPQAELDGEVGNQQMALQARLMSKGLRGLAGLLSKTGCILMFVNQLRQKVGVIYGSNEVTTGGHGLKYFASVRIDIRKVSSGNIMEGSEQIGFRAKAKVAKNKVARPFLTGEFDILFGRGINSEGCVFDVAESYKIINRRGSYYYYGEMKLGQGRRPALQTVMEDLELLPKIKDEIQAKLDEERKMHAEKRAEAIGSDSPLPYEGSDEDMTEDDFVGSVEPL